MDAPWARGGASRGLCSPFNPALPFLNTMTENDLSNQRLRPSWLWKAPSASSVRSEGEDSSRHTAKMARSMRSKVSALFRFLRSCVRICTHTEAGEQAGSVSQQTSNRRRKEEETRTLAHTSLLSAVKMPTGGWSAKHSVSSYTYLSCAWSSALEIGWSWSSRTCTV